MSSSNKVLNWGIVSAGKISHDFVTAVATLPATDHKVIAVAARELLAAKEFAKLHDIQYAYEGYECLAKNPEIEIIYVGTLNPYHYEICKMMLENGKHILCEKPLCMNKKESASLLKFAKSKNLFLMEAIWSRFLPPYQYLRKQIDSGALGELQEVQAEFGFSVADVDRVRFKDYGGGTILDLGVYTIQASLFGFREPPISIKATGTLNEDGVDLAMNAELTFSNGRKAKISTNAFKLLDNKAVFIGTKGQITLHDFWSSTSLTDVDGKLKSWKLPIAKHYFNFPNSCGLRYEAEESRLCIRAGLLESESVSHSESLSIAEIEDEIRKQIGVHYPADDVDYD